MLNPPEFFYRPVDLARELDAEPFEIRAYLRLRYKRLQHQKRKHWLITEEMANEVRAFFKMRDEAV